METSWWTLVKKIMYLLSVFPSMVPFRKKK